MDKTNLLHFLLLVLIFYQFLSFLLKIWLNIFRDVEFIKLFSKMPILKKNVKNDLVPLAFPYPTHTVPGQA